MEILGIGMPELIFILIIALLVLQPKDMERTGRTIGRWLNNVIKSKTWQTMRTVTREIRTLPNQLMKEANMELAYKTEFASSPDLKESPAPKAPARSKPTSPQTPPGTFPENQIAPVSPGQNQTESESESPNNA